MGSEFVVKILKIVMKTISVKYKIYIFQIGKTYPINEYYRSAIALVCIADTEYL